VTTSTGALLADRWRLGDRLGGGAAADVFEALDVGTGERVAVKLLRGADDLQRARFGREVAALEALDHPGVVSVRGHGELDGRPFVVLDCVEGGSLADELATRGSMPPTDAAALGAAVADALDHVHRAGVVHRDVKPSNVLLDPSGRPLLADFGVAHLTGADTLTASGCTVGTAAYLAPEQVRGEHVGPAADVYALGLLILEATTGERAYPGAGVAAALARLEAPPEIPASVPIDLAAHVRSMTALAPGDRPSAATVAASLAVVAEGRQDETAVLPVVDEVTEQVVIAAPDAAASPRHGSAIVAAACFALGVVLVLVARLLTGGLGGGGLEVPPSTVTTVPAPPPTTASPATTVPPPAAGQPDDERGDDDDGEGRGNGRGGGRGGGGEDD
jgi:serine/threonine protein kinase